MPWLLALLAWSLATPTFAAGKTVKAASPAPIAKSTSHADRLIQQIEAGLSVPVMLGDSAQRFSGRLGFFAQALLNRNLFDPQLVPVASIQYQSLGFSDASGMRSDLFNLMFGVRAMPDAATIYGLVPYLELQAGLSINIVQISGTGPAGSNVTPSFIAMLSPGVILPLSSKFDANYAMPIYFDLMKSGLLLFSAFQFSGIYHL